MCGERATLLKGKSFLLVFLVMLPIFGWAVTNIRGQVATKVYVDPPLVTADPGETFTVDVDIADVKGLWVYEFRLGWDSALLDVTSVTEGPFLNAEGFYKTFFFKSIWNEPDPMGVSGYIYVTCTLMGEPRTATASGNGTLATVEFLVKEEGSTSLHLYDTLLEDYDLKEMSHTTEDGYFQYPVSRLYVDPPSITDPTLLPGTTFQTNINLNDSVRLYEWSFNMSWDPTVLNVSNIEEGSFLNHEGDYNTTFTTNVDQENGRAYINCTLSGEPAIAAANGSGTLATVTFQVKQKWISYLDLYDIKLLNYERMGLYYTVEQDGHWDEYFNPLPLVYIDPLTIVDPSLWPGTSFQINVNVANVEYLYAWTLDVTWDPELLEVSSAADVTEGNFLSDKGDTIFMKELYPDAGYAHINSTLSGEPTAGVNGSGTLVTVTFQVKAAGGCNITLTNIKLLYYNMSEILTGPPRSRAYFNNISRDVAIISVSVSPSRVRAGDSVSISIVAKNEGEITFGRSVDVAIYYNESFLGRICIPDVDPGGQETRSFGWNTKDLAEGNYTIEAVAGQVPGETNTANNRYVYEYLMVRPPEQTFPFTLVAVAAAIIVVGIFGLLLKRRR